MVAFIESAGFFTMLKFVLNQTPSQLENRIGYVHGALAMGWRLLSPVSPIDGANIDLRGSTRWPEGILGDGRPIKEVIQANLVSAQTKIEAFFRKEFENQPTKVLPNRILSSDCFVPAKAGIPQFKLFRPVKWNEVCALAPGKTLKQEHFLSFSGLQKALTAPALLTYDTPQQILSGSIDSAHFKLLAYSGGGRGSTNPSLWQNKPNSWEATTKAIPGIQRGGTLPSGYYLCEYLPHHRRFGECIRLHRTSSSAAVFSPFSAHPIPHFRDDDFFIHGRGAEGSDGCIVQADRQERLRLNGVISHFKGRVYLLVQGSGYMLPAERGG